MSFSSCSTEPTCARTCDCISGPCKCEWQTKLLISTTDTPSPMQMNHAAYSAAQAHGAEAILSPSTHSQDAAHESGWRYSGLLPSLKRFGQTKPRCSLSHTEAMMPATQPPTLSGDTETAALSWSFTWQKNHYCDCETTAREKEKQCLPRGAISYVLLDLLLS